MTPYSHVSRFVAIVRRSIPMEDDDGHDGGEGGKILMSQAISRPVMLSTPVSASQKRRRRKRTSRREVCDLFDGWVKAEDGFGRMIRTGSSLMAPRGTIRMDLEEDEKMRRMTNG